MGDVAWYEACFAGTGGGGASLNGSAGVGMDASTGRTGRERFVRTLISSDGEETEYEIEVTREIGSLDATE
jgi:hypothetical protein